MNNGLISIIIPVYNPGQHLNKCLDSIINQTYKNLEIILVDDGSSDGSGAICDSYASNDSRITCIHQENQGVSSARNAGLAACNGDYVHFPDSDDYLDLNTYEILMSEITNCEAVVFEYTVEYPDRSFEHTHPLEHDGIVDGIEAVIRLFSGYHFVCNKLMCRELIEKLSFRTDILRGEDTLFAAQALLRANKVRYISNPFYHYVQSNDSATRGSFRTSQLSILKLYDAYESLFSGLAPNVLDTCISYLQDNLIGIYYDMWGDQRSFDSERKLVNNYLRRYYKKACDFNKGNTKKLVKFFMATYFPDLFCRLHKIIHKI